jgi:hypothetical protein
MFHKGLHYAPITLALLAALVPQEQPLDMDRSDNSCLALEGKKADHTVSLKQ